jgi:hypothetical protein
MGNAPSSAVLQAVHNGDVQAVRIAIQEHPTQIDDTEPTVGAYNFWQHVAPCSCCCLCLALLLLLLVLALLLLCIMHMLYACLNA